MGKKLIPGLTREAEDAQLKEILGIAQENLDRTEGFIKMLMEDLKDIQENFEVSDKETLVLWNTAEAQLQETKRDLARHERARKKPYFGRIDFKDSSMRDEESYYIGRVGIAKDTSEPIVIDWRAPIASAYYESSLGPCNYEVRNEGSHEIDLLRKRTYEIVDDELKDFFDSDVVATDELLTKYLAKSKKAVLGEIIATIQQEQNEIIRKTPRANLIVQGVAGSGKTTVAMHRISYILYNYEDEFRPEDFYIIGSNRILLNYITSVLPDLDVYGVSQMTMEQLFVRLLYEDWDKNKYNIKALDKRDELSCIKGSYEWFHDLEEFCNRYEESCFPMEDVYMEKTGNLIMNEKLIRHVLKNNIKMSMQEKINTLNEFLVAAVENEIQGKGHSFPIKERNELMKKYGQYFGKSPWKGSIYDLYTKFLIGQREKGKEVEIPADSFDVYDLAALAFLYKRIKEIDGIREASHIVIDEAQDFGMMAYGVLHYCMRDCTYTIMGDVSQNIHFGFGLNDWEDLKSLILTGDYDCFELLKKSYRNTVEISEYATEILRHGNFSIYPVEPILRHGSEVKDCRCESLEELITASIDCINQWKQEGHETIAIVCRDEAEVNEVTKALEGKIELVDSNLETTEFGSGVMVLPVEYTKGLEFDAVILFNPTCENYPKEDGYVKQLYVAATRALHELAVLHTDDFTELISVPVSKEKRMQSLMKETGSRLKQFKREKVTDRQRQLQDIHDTDKERSRRGYIGPKMVRTDDLIKKEPPKKPVMPRKVEPLKVEEKVDIKAVSRGVQIEAGTNPSVFNFLDMPDTAKLTPKGHTRSDNMVRWINKTKEQVEITSNYGVLRIIPVQEDVIHICFKKGQIGEFSRSPFSMEKEANLKWTAKDERTRIVVETAKIQVVVEKKTGAVQFFDKKGKLLLQEKALEPRQIEVGQRGCTWTYFDWKKKEKLQAKGIGKNDLRPISGKANYISFGGKSLRMPVIVSDEGYTLSIAARAAVLFCNIAAYGNYICAEDMDIIDYYFQII